ncbi:MAG: response regulator [Cyanobacteria bacterium J06638_20]
MVDEPKLVLMIQPNRLQGLIWKTILKSQKISAIQESSDSDLFSSLTELKQAGLTLPHVLLIDINQIEFNPYSFCRWCREKHPDVKVVLTNSSQMNIPLPERQWAQNQGAADLLPGFQIDNLVSSVASSTKRLLEALHYTQFDNAALISTLLRMKRELDARRMKEANGAIADPISSVTEESVTPATFSLREPKKLQQNGHASAQPAKPSTPPQSPTPEAEPVKRRYRGVIY